MEYDSRMKSWTCASGDEMLITQTYRNGFEREKSQGGGHDIYRQASALEVILGWWMVTDDERLDEVLDFVKSSGWLEDALTLGPSWFRGGGRDNEE